jgi:glycosyltransferase involved in cell wall biosynthesis
MPKPRLSVAVCTWNHSRLLRDCLSSLLEQDARGDFELLIVDDGSTYETPAVAEKAAATDVPVRYLRQEHAGLNAARNLAVNEAAGDVIHFFDDDQLAPAGHLRRVIAWFDQRADLDGVGGPCRDFGGGLRTCPDCSLAAVDVPGEGIRATERLLGGNMAISANVFREVGLFDDRLSGRGDETEWFGRAAGRTFIQDPGLWIWHRRDHIGLWSLCRRSFRQGLSRPLAFEQQGKRYRFEVRSFLRYLGHATRRRCAKGIELAARELGSAYAAATSNRTTRLSSS